MRDRHFLLIIVNFIPTQSFSISLFVGVGESSCLFLPFFFCACWLPSTGRNIFSFSFSFVFIPFLFHSFAISVFFFFWWQHFQSAEFLLLTLSSSSFVIRCVTYSCDTMRVLCHVKRLDLRFELDFVFASKSERKSLFISVTKLKTVAQ